MKIKEDGNLQIFLVYMYIVQAISIFIQANKSGKSISL